MNKIFKYELHGRAALEIITAHEGARALGVHEQNGGLFLWMEVDTSKPVKELHFIIALTGDEVPADSEFVGTAFLQSAAYVLHVYQVGV